MYIQLHGTTVEKHTYILSCTCAVTKLFYCKVEKFHPRDIQPSLITFEWALPSDEQNGIIRKFTITYGLEVEHFQIMVDSGDHY